MPRSAAKSIPAVAKARCLAAIGTAIAPQRKFPPRCRPITARLAGDQEDDEATKARREAWQTYYAQLAQLQKDRLTAATSAHDVGHRHGQQWRPDSPPLGRASGAAPSFAGAASGGTEPAAGVGSAGIVGDPALPAASGCRSIRRRGWTRAGSGRSRPSSTQPGDATGASDDLQAVLHDPSSPYLVMAGTAIPAVMIGGINSDMPGMVDRTGGRERLRHRHGALSADPARRAVDRSIRQHASRTGRPGSASSGIASSIRTRNRSTWARWRARTRAAMRVSMTR